MEDRDAYRVLILEDDESIRQILRYYFESRKYDVFTFSNPKDCPLHGVSSCRCPLEESCSDIIICDLNMPFKKGITFLEEQLSKGCRCKNVALMSCDFGREDLARASKLNIKLIQKPFEIKEIEKWVTEIEKKIPPERKLSNWFQKK